MHCIDTWSSLVTVSRIAKFSRLLRPVAVSYTHLTLPTIYSV